MPRGKREKDDGVTCLPEIKYLVHFQIYFLRYSRRGSLERKINRLFVIRVYFKKKQKSQLALSRVLV